MLKKTVAMLHLHITSSSHGTATHNTKWICRSDIRCRRVEHAFLKKSEATKRENTADDLSNAEAHLGEKVILLEWRNQPEAGCRQYMHNLDVLLIFKRPVPLSVVGLLCITLKKETRAAPHVAYVL